MSLVGVVLLFALSALSPNFLQAAEQLYTCGMHPQIIKKQPGNCPICGMTLTPIRANSAGETTAKPDPGKEISTVGSGVAMKIGGV